MASLELEVPGGLALEHEGDDVEEEHQNNDADNSSTAGKKGKKKRDASTLRKAPQAPKRFKSSYICFFMAMQPKIKEELGDKATVTEISKRSAQMWRTLPQEDRAHWDDVAAKDKQRFLVEKAAYTGPWQVPWKRTKKDPSAPKRPMSAFLYFSQGKRRQIKEANPSMKNTEVSRLLGEMWRNAPESEKMPHIEKEKGEREKYKVAIADWRKDYDARVEKERKAQAEQAAYMANMYPPPTSETQHQQYPPPPYDPNMYPGQQSNMGPPPPSAPGYGYGAPPSYPPYAWPAPYQYPTNGKQPVILGPSGTPRYPPPAAANYNSGPPPPHHMQQQAPPTSHQYGGAAPPQQGYDMSQGHQAHPHYEYPSEQQGMEHPPSPAQTHHHHHPQHQQPPQHHHQE